MKNMPKEIVADDRGMAVVKNSSFKAMHPTIAFLESDIIKIEKVLNRKKESISYNWCEFLKSSDSYVNGFYLLLEFEEWTKHSISQFRDGYCNYKIWIHAHEDEWYTITKVNIQYGYTSFYIADQIDELLNYLDEI